MSGENRNLKFLDCFPKKLSPGCRLYIDYELASKLKYLPIELYKDLELEVFNLKDLDLFHIENFEINLIYSFSEFRKINGSFSGISTSAKVESLPAAFPKLERLYLVYEKLNFDKEKFERALELL